MVNFGKKHPIRELKIATCAGYAVEITDFIFCILNKFTFNFEVLDVWIVAPCSPQLHQLRQQRDLNSLPLWRVPLCSSPWQRQLRLMDFEVFRAVRCAKMTTNLCFHKKQSRNNWNGSSSVNYMIVTLFQRALDLCINNTDDTGDKCKLKPNTDRKKKKKKRKRKSLPGPKNPPTWQEIHPATGYGNSVGSIHC